MYTTENSVRGLELSSGRLVHVSVAVTTGPVSLTVMFPPSVGGAVHAEPVALIGHSTVNVTTVAGTSYEEVTLVTFVGLVGWEEGDVC